MLNIKLHVSSIEYPATFHTLYPYLSAYLTRPDRQNLLKSLVISLDGDAERVFVSWLPYLEEGERKKLIAGIINQNSSRLIPLLNEKLQGTDLGKYIRLGTLEVNLPGNGFFIEFDGVKGTIPALVNEIAKKKPISPYITTAIKAATFLTPNLVEKESVKWINVPEIKSEIVKTLQNALTDKGIAVQVDDMEVVHVPKQDMPPASEPGSVKILDDESEKIIVDAMVRYLLKNAGQT